MATYKVKEGAPVGIKSGGAKLQPGETFDDKGVPKSALEFLEAKGRIEKVAGAAPKKAAEPAEELSLKEQQAVKPKAKG